MSTEDVIISQPKGTRTLALRESYLAICQGDKCEAHLLNANERWYAYKLKERNQARHRNKAAQAGGETPEADESLWVFMSAKEWSTDLLGMYDEKTIRKALGSLIERGFMTTRSNPKRKWDRKPQWLFQRANVQAAVDAWAATRPDPDLDPSPADDTEVPENTVQDDSGETDNSIRENYRVHSGKLPNALGKSGASIRENYRSNTTGISLRDLSQESFTGGEYNVTGDARATTPLTPAAPVAEPSPAQLTTTEDAALQKTLEAVREPSASVAVLDAPDADGSGEGISDAELDLLFDTQGQASAEPETATGLEEVPGAAAGAGAAALAGPLAGLEVPHNPEDTRLVLTRALGGPTRLATLLDETPPGLRDGTRHRWVSEITPERAQELITEGRAQKVMHPWTAITQLLDQEIGAQIVRGQGGSAPAMAMPGAYATAEDRAAQASALPPVANGETWFSRKSGTAYTVAEVTSQTVVIEGVGEYAFDRFHRLFRSEA